MITSLLDNDFYAFTMAQAIHDAGDSNLKVRYEFRNRTFAVPLARRVKLGRLYEEIEKIRDLTFTSQEIKYLEGLGLFTPDFLKSLWGLKLPEVRPAFDNGHLVMTFEGNWGDAIFWESMLLATVNEMYYSRFGGFLEEGEQRLHEKIAYLQNRKTLKFAEFGTRRRFSSSWQHYVAHVLKDEVPELMVGTSNVQLAKDLELKPVGTMAHQLFMVYTALAQHGSVPWKTGDPLAAGANRVMELWLNAYKNHPRMLTVLPDTYTTKAFLERADQNLLAEFHTFRQDSGDPIAVGRQLVQAAQELGHSKPTIMFSDSLDVRKMSVIEDHFADTIQMVSGWGTDLTNDLGYEPLSIVIKPCAVEVSPGIWESCVKLSDDPQKETGKDAWSYRLLANTQD